MLKRTPLYDRHRELGARMVEFGGWEMPVQYSGILEEHRAVRKRAGLFDVSHMGEIQVVGDEALPFLRRMLTNDPAHLTVGQAQYTLMCLPTGGVVDDLIAYRLGDNRYLLIVNAANIDKDYTWLTDHATDRVEVVNLSDEKGLLALQGPQAVHILASLTDVDLSALRYYHAVEGQVAGIPALISRTGYTGEDGFEIMVDASRVVALWDALLETGRDHGLLPAGLGARDTLRLEAAMPLYGHELTEEINPLEAGLERFVKLEKEDFIGRDALLAVREQGLQRKLIGFEVTGKGIARQGYEILHDGQAVGVVTSGTYAPFLEKAIGMGFVPVELSEPGTEIEIRVRKRSVPARVVKRPFYKRPR